MFCTPINGKVHWLLSLEVDPISTFPIHLIKDVTEAPHIKQVETSSESSKHPELRPMHSCFITVYRVAK